MAWVVDTCVLPDIRLRDVAFGVSSAHCLQSHLKDCEKPRETGCAAAVGTALRAVRGERSEAAGETCAATKAPAASLTLARRTSRSAVPTRLRRLASQPPRHFSTVEILVPQ